MSTETKPETKDDKVKKVKPKKSDIDLIVLSVKSFILIAGLGVLIISAYAFIFFILAMLPSFTAIMIDRRITKAASGTICAFNLTGVLPYIFSLWHTADVNAMAKSLITNFNAWAIIYFTTSLGWLMILLMPQTCATIFQIRSVKKVKNLEIKLKELIEIWGDDIENHKV
jgi:hypothetical protein